eukprot:TRINITY_DN219_c1_g1_i1.p1 TRINITY_DN219_c1_g1~~TRINITY_DN219_c1_g1_i1.p1  ORF type:complete len:1038 (+),score=462.47 TRINITY_DN219_c1_g1_i1:78-3191(+)
MSKEIYRPGEKIFYVNPTTGWAIGTLVEYGKKVKVTDGGEEFVVPQDDCHNHTEGAYDKSYNDLFAMGDLHQATLLYCLKGRYEDDGMMFTRMGEIIISINPFCFKEYNSREAMEKHTAGKWDHPHTWEVAHKAYKKIIVMDRQNQSILISGESGAGKTETAKTLIDYLGMMSYSHSCNAVQKTLAESVNKKLKASNPILESFGNAKTSRNDNSSRFGKYIKLFFNKESGVLTGAEMVHYLLEKSRIVTQNEGERGYHVFYEFLAGATPEMREKYHVTGKPQDYYCLSRGNQFIRELNGRITEDLGEYKNLMQAFKDTGITDAQQDSIFRVLASILNLQNVKFITDESSGKAKIENPEIVDVVAKLLQVDPKGFHECLLIKARTKIMTQMADVNEATDMRDALSKALYSGVFDWLVCKLNTVISPEANGSTTAGKNTCYIGLLDIFGFENFKINSFEQFCINYTNESLQNRYNKFTFDLDKQECDEEGISCPIMEYPDNKPCLDMLEMDKKGVMSMLDAECAFKLGTDESFTEKAWGSWGETEFFIKPKSTRADHFSVKHYAAEVKYMTKGWLEKNSDTLKDDMKLVVNASQDSDFIGTLLGEPEDAAGGKKKPTVSFKFKQQLKSLQDELNSTDSHFIRTVKPNPEMKAGMINNGYVMTQLTCAGVIETIIMKRQGYPVRQRHKEFWLRYRIIAPKDVKKRFPAGTHPNEQEMAGVCREIAQFWVNILGSKAPHFDIGHTKVFSKSKVNEGLEIVRHRKIRRLLPRCVPFLLKWIAAYKKKKAELEEKRRLAQIAIREAAEARAKALAEGGGTVSAGLETQKEAEFTELADLFPHFDLPVILNIVEQSPTKDIALDFLLDMQKQRVAEALPLTVQAVFEEAKLRTSTQEKLIERGITDREKLYELSSDEMAEIGFSTEERENLAGVLLSQQSNWIVNQRLNVLMGAEDRNADEIAADLAMLEKAAAEIKKDLEGHLAGKYAKQFGYGDGDKTKLPPSADQIKRFVSMGFTEQQAKDALKKAGNNAAKACDILLGDA